MAGVRCLRAAVSQLGRRRQTVRVVDGVVHYCVANMPGAVARTSTYALNNVTLPHALKIAELGWKGALKANPHLAAGLNVHEGKVTYEAVASELGYDYAPVAELLG